VDITSLCILGIIVFLGFTLMSRMMGAGRGYPGGGMGRPPVQRGPLRPQADDPDVQSRGGFGEQPAPRRGGDGGGNGGYPGRQGGSLFPQSGGRDRDDEPRTETRSDGGFPGRQGGALFPQRDDDDRDGRSAGRGSLGSRGDRPDADDPDVESKGGFGRPKG
jgi:hypothetical protein